MSTIYSNLLAGHYNKFLVAVLYAVITVVVQFYGTNTGVQIALSVLTALGVYSVPNKQA